MRTTYIYRDVNHGMRAESEILKPLQDGLICTPTLLSRTSTHITPVFGGFFQLFCFFTWPVRARACRSRLYKLLRYI